MFVSENIQLYGPLLIKYQCRFIKVTVCKTILCTCLTNGSAQWIIEAYLGYCLETYLKHLAAFSLELLIMKLHAYGFNFATLRLMHSYLTSRTQRTKFITKVIFPGKKNFLGFSKDLHSPLYLFSICLCGMFFLISETEFSSLADNNGPYVAIDNVDDVIDDDVK